MEFTFLCGTLHRAPLFLPTIAFCDTLEEREKLINKALHVLVTSSGSQCCSASKSMLLDRTTVGEEASAKQKETPDQPLTCMIYFFASQMSRHIQTPAPPAQPTHRLDTLLKKMSTHAAFSPLITRFETFPVELPPQPPGPLKRKTTVPNRDLMHDTLLLVNFRSRRAREEWIQTREWMEFMERTEREGVFRRVPHVRCAGSLRGLSDPREVLGL